MKPQTFRFYLAMTGLPAVLLFHFLGIPMPLALVFPGLALLHLYLD